MKDLVDVNDFGTIDAENDTRLLEYFVKTDIIDELLNYEKSIIIGRKGSGKTAIYRYIKSIKGNCCADLLFKQYPWKVHDLFKNNDVSDRESYVNSWTFFFLVEILKKMIIQKENVNTRKAKKLIRKSKKWLKINWGSITFDHNEILTPQKTKYSFIFSPQIMGNGIGSLSRDISCSTNLGGMLTEYNKKLESVILDILEGYNGEIILMFDELDLSYSENDINYKNRLIGLLLAAYSFYNKFDKKIKIFIFLRNDIFNLLEFQDKNKIKDNMVEFLDWNGNELTSPLSLKNVISLRLIKHMELETEVFEDAWDAVFDNAKIGKNQSKWNFIIDRTFIRPRDAIKFINLALEQAHGRINSYPDTIHKINSEDLRDIRSKYSTYLFEELRDEMVGKYPDYSEYMEILRNIHTMTFDLSKFEESYNQLNDRYSFEIDMETILERLYEFSIIGFYKPGGGGYGGSEYRFQYTSDYQAFNSHATKFKVHQGFKEYLELVES